MEGFFSKKETESKERPGGKKYSCASCGLYRHAETPKMEPFGNFKKDILCVGSYPNKYEDLKGTPWQGRESKLLIDSLEKLGIDLFEDCLSVNAIRCFPGNAPKVSADVCRKSILQIIDERQPKLILLFGIQAITCVLGHKWKRGLGKTEKWRGMIIPDKDLKTWVCPLIHPAHIRNDKKEEKLVWNLDLSNAINTLKTPFPRWPKIDIKIIEDLSVLSTIKEGLVAFDYETTGVKPQGKGHRIVCASIAVSSSLVYVFMMPKSKKEREPFLELLKNPNVGKMAHNMKFEDHWTEVKLKTSIFNWTWDSMLAAHILDNRTGVTGLKYQAFVRFGVRDYDSEITPYLQAEGSNDINKIGELIDKPGGQEKLLEYCALDSIYQYRLAMLQMKEIEYDFLPF
jgi:uracil-DNA glycosylase family 4